MDEAEANDGPEFLAEEWEQVKELVFEYQQQEPADLNSWLDAHSPSDKVRREVERLLRSASTCGEFLERPAAHEYFGLPRRQPERIGRYRVLEQIGSGGMGVVYAAMDEELNRRVAIKVLLAHSADDPEQQKRLRWDATAASALQHPNIVTVHEVGSDDGRDFVVMECIPGQTLGRLIPAAGMETAEALRCAVQIASGLEAAHNAQIVHRDLKPGNIMITETGAVKLLDFGLAKHNAARLSAGETPLTIEGTFAGTVAYVSPEQAEGKPVDARSDIFSFGSVLFEMLTGRRAFPGESPIAVLADILHHDPPSLNELKPRLDARLDDIVRRCLRKKRERRFQSIAEVKLRLLEIEEEIQYAEQDRTASHAIVTRQRAGRFWRGAAAGAVATAVLAAGLFWMTRQREPRVVLYRSTNDVGLTEFPAISRDGKLLAYASDRAGEGNLDVFVQQVRGSEPIQPLTTDPADDYEPTFAPDGTQVVYRSDRNGGGLYVNSSLGGAERLLVAGGRGAQFSPDGKWLAYWTGEIGASLYPGTARIWIMPATGGPAKPFRPDFPAAALPVWAPQGDRLLFLGRGRDTASGDSPVDWWVASIERTWSHATGLLMALNDQGLRPPPITYRITPSAWLASGLVLFTATQEDATNVWAVRLNQDGVASRAAERWTAGTLLELHPAYTYSDESSSLAYTALTQSIGVWKVPLNARGEAAGRAQSLVSGFDGISSPSVSADGMRLVFASRWSGGQFIRMKDLKSGALSVIGSVKNRRVARPVLSGDGKTMAYCEGAAGYVRNVPNGVPERICQSCGPPTHLSFDGRDVLFESPQSPERILISSDRKPPRPLLQLAAAQPWMEFGARFSPDGRWVVFAGSPAVSPARHIWIAPVRKEGPVREDELVPLTDGPSSDKEPYWSPDGKRVYFLSDRDGFVCVWAREVDPVTARPRGAAFHVTDFHHARRVIQGATVYSGDIGLSVSGDSVVFALSEYTSNIWLKTEYPQGR